MFTCLLYIFHLMGADIRGRDWLSCMFADAIMLGLLVAASV